MTIRTNARVAGIAFLVYIAAGITDMARVFGHAVQVELTFVQIFCALVLAVTLYAITREVDEEVALIAMMCRVGEGVSGAAALAAKVNGFGVGATLFAAGSTLFCWLLLRGRLVPRPLAWLGLLASVLALAIVPLEFAGTMPNAFWVWIPMLIFELTVAVWLIAKGVSQPHL